MKVVYVPQHLYGALKQAGLTARDLGDVGKLLTTLSAEDVAFYFYANTPKVKSPLPSALQEHLPNLLFDPESGRPWSSTDTAAIAVMRQWNSMVQNGCNASMYEKNAILTSDCTEEDLLIITHVVQSDTAAGEKNQFDETAFYDRIIQQLLAFQKVEQVMASAVMTAWLKSVRNSGE